MLFTKLRGKNFIPYRLIILSPILSPTIPKFKLYLGRLWTFLELIRTGEGVRESDSKRPDMEGNGSVV